MCGLRLLVSSQDYGMFASTALICHHTALVLAQQEGSRDHRNAQQAHSPKNVRGAIGGVAFEPHLADLAMVAASVMFAFETNPSGDVANCAVIVAFARPASFGEGPNLDTNSAVIEKPSRTEFATATVGLYKATGTPGTR